jgi:hypothetical protein
MNEVTYHVEVADMQAFQRHHRRISPQVRRVRIFLWLFFCAFSLHSAIRNQTSFGRGVIYFFVMLAMLAAVIAAINFVTNWIARFRADHTTERNGVLGEHTITLAAEGLHERTAVNDSKASWRGIFRVDATPTHLFIFTQPNAAFVIPRRAFPTTEAAEQFFSTARAYHQAAVSPDAISAR